jgi:hypothetical protein
MYESRYLGRLFLNSSAAAVARLFDRTVDQHIAIGFNAATAKDLVRAAVPFDFDPAHTADVQRDHNRAVHDGCWSVSERALANQEKTMRIGQAFPSEYLKASDLMGRTVKVTMSHVEMREVGDGPKPILHFVGKEKGLVLNKTNSNNITAAYGDETDNWQAQIARKGEREASRVAAATALLDRGYGRPPQAVDMRLLLNKRLSELTAEELLMLEAQLVAMGADEDGSHDTH